LTFDEINEKIEKVISEYFEGDVPEWLQRSEDHRGTRHGTRQCVLVVTGGEPMLQKNLVPFLEYMNTEFFITQVESNGTVYQELPGETTLVVSPKCSEKNGVATKYLKPNQKVLEIADCLKFVMSADLSSPYSSVPEWVEDLDMPGKVYISPMNIYNSLTYIFANRLAVPVELGSLSTSIRSALRSSSNFNVTSSIIASIVDSVIYSLMLSHAKKRFPSTFIISLAVFV